MPGNTGVETIAEMLNQFPTSASEDPFVVVSIHRFETLMSQWRLTALVNFILDVASQVPVRFILHEPTESRLKHYGLLSKLREGGIRLMPSLDYPDFLHQLQIAQFVVADGGSIQEECAFLGTPCLLFRKRTERRDGLGENVCLSGLKPDVLRAFVRGYPQYRRPYKTPEVRPSDAVIDFLVSLGYAQVAKTTA
jgi:UDP-N-acetylglucosamine 2-epimerase (non-hydrolysing)